MKTYLNKYPYLPYYFFIGCSLFAVHFILWSFTGMWPLKADTYNSYAIQAVSWLNGRLDLKQNYSYLEIAVYNGKYYISFPPFPSAIMLPLVYFFGEHPPDGLVSFIFAVLAGIFSFKSAKNFKLNNQNSLFWSLFLCAGSNLLFVSSRGGVWFSAQIIGFACVIMSIYFATSKPVKDSLFSFLFLAFAFGCRPFHVLYFPLILFFVCRRYFYSGKRKNRFVLNFVGWCIPAGLVILIYMGLNYARFHNVFEFGHSYLPEFQHAELGQFSVSYLKENWKRLFELPTLDREGIIRFPDFNGVAFWIVNPLFLSFGLYWVYSVGVMCFSAQEDEWYPSGMSILYFIPVFIMANFVLLCMHKTMGGWHFGNRYTVDALPFAFVGLVGILRHGRIFTFLSYPLFFYGLCVNVVGTILFYRM